MVLTSTLSNRSVVAALCEGLAETITKVGPAFIENREHLGSEIVLPWGSDFGSEEIDQVCSIAMQVLEQKALCQQDPDQDESDEAFDDQAEYDSVLISSAGDLVAALAGAIGADFVQAFRAFLPLIAKFYVSLHSLRLQVTSLTSSLSEKGPFPQ